MFVTFQNFKKEKFYLNPNWFTAEQFFLQNEPMKVTSE